MTFEEIKNKLEMTANLLAFNVLIEKRNIENKEMYDIGAMPKTSKIDADIVIISVDIDGLDTKQIVTKMVKVFGLNEKQSKNLVEGIVYVECH